VGLFAYGNQIVVPASQSFTIASPGVTSSFTASQRLLVSLSLSSGTINYALLQLELVSDSSPKGFFMFPQGVSRYQRLSISGQSMRFRLLGNDGGGTLGIQVNLL
jgi:hypothetical protein